jgi:DNA-binding CsgD family transcriptional regulator
LLSLGKAEGYGDRTVLDVQADTADKLSDCIAAIGAEDFWQALRYVIASQVPHQMSAAFVYADQDPPVRIFNSEDSPERDEVHKILATVGYLISPYYNGLIRTGAEGGFYHIDAVAPDEFRASEYFEVYYGRKRVEDEGMFLVRPDDHVTVVFMVERHRDTARYSPLELEDLHGLFPIVSSLIERHVRLAGLGDILSPESRATRSAFREISARFGADFLSARERDVAMLILRGHSSKSAARLLDISPETERVHRRRLYTKLGIGSHSELFWLFLQASEFFDPAADIDPLVVFLRKKRPELLAASE